jgi:hypothetical protein
VAYSTDTIRIGIFAATAIGLVEQHLPPHFVAVGTRFRSTSCSEVVPAVGFSSDDSAL